MIFFCFRKKSNIQKKKKKCLKEQRLLCKVLRTQQWVQSNQGTATRQSQYSVTQGGDEGSTRCCEPGDSRLRHTPATRSGCPEKGVPHWGLKSEVQRVSRRDQENGGGGSRKDIWGRSGAGGRESQTTNKQIK